MTRRRPSAPDPRGTGPRPAAAPRVPGAGRPSTGAWPPPPPPGRRTGPAPERKGFPMLLTLTRLITAALLIASAAAFAAGATVEHHAASSESHAVRQEQRPEAGTAGENPAGAERTASSEGSATHAADRSSVIMLGINRESTALAGSAGAGSATLAVQCLASGSP